MSQSRYVLVWNILEAEFKDYVAETFNIPVSDVRTAVAGLLLHESWNINDLKHQ